MGELAVAAAAIGVILVADVRGATGFSSLAVLVYYAIANASEFTLARDERRSSRVVSVLGLIGCVALGASLPAASIIGGTGLLTLGAIVWSPAAVTRRERPPDPTAEVSPSLGPRAASHRPAPRRCCYGMSAPGRCAGPGLGVRW